MKLVHDLEYCAIRKKHQSKLLKRLQPSKGVAAYTLEHVFSLSKPAILKQ